MSPVLGPARGPPDTERDLRPSRIPRLSRFQLEPTSAAVSPRFHGGSARSHPSIKTRDRRQSQAPEPDRSFFAAARHVAGRRQWSRVAGRRPDETGLWPGFGYSPGVSFFAWPPLAARRARASASAFT